MIDWVDQREVPLLTELTPTSSRELLSIQLPFVVLYLPGMTSDDACDDPNAYSVVGDADEADDAGSADGAEELPDACAARRYAAAREAHRELLDTYEAAAARYSFGDTKDAAECWESVALGTAASQSAAVCLLSYAQGRCGGQAAILLPSTSSVCLRATRM